MAPNLTVSVLEHSRISPPPDTIPELSLPLSFYDIPWLHYHHMQCLYFYKLHNSMTNVIETIIPDIKSSLSLTLKHYLPLAGNLLYPLNSGKPELKYVTGDSVPLVVAQCGYDFNFLKGNHPRKAEDFYPLFHKLPRVPNMATDCKKIPLFAVQVTIFPDVGITMGFTFHHVIGDARSMGDFIKAWTSINKFGGDAEIQAGGSLPCLDRSIIKDPHGLKDIFWSLMKDKIERFFYQPEEEKDDRSEFDFNKVRATYVFPSSDIQKLKNLVLEQKPEAVRISAFVVVCAYVWTCLLKSATATGEKVDGNEVQHFCFAADHRARPKSSVPGKYFGNCLVACLAKVELAQLIGNEGFIVAAVSIGEAIERMVHNEEGTRTDVINWISSQLGGKRCSLFGVSGSPKFDSYAVDYGWGKPEKYEIVSIDQCSSMSLNRARKFEGGLEVGLSLSNIKMEVFENIFNKGLITI